MNQFEMIGGIAPREPVAREIELDGKKVTFYFVQHGYADLMAKMGDDLKVPEGKRKELVVLASTLRIGEAGEVSPTYEQVAGLKPPLIKKLVEAAYAVNSAEDDAKN